MPTQLHLTNRDQLSQRPSSQWEVLMGRKLEEAHRSGFSTWEDL